MDNEQLGMLDNEEVGKQLRTVEEMTDRDIHRTAMSNSYWREIHSIVRRTEPLRQLWISLTPRERELYTTGMMNVISGGYPHGGAPIGEKAVYIVGLGM